ncbi:MAG TPA: L-lactate permease, partial [Bacillota bacterium]|nr:L-lactate permease [Bacillota bacterium]
QLFHSSFKGLLTSSVVAYVLLFGIFLFHLMNETGLISSIASFISCSTRDPVQQVILLVVAFSPLVESVSGFGIAIIVVAPILVMLGFNRYKATILSLVGLSAVPWGALATGTVIGSNLSEIPLQQLGAGSALIALPTFLYFAFIAAYLSGGLHAIKQRWLELTMVSVSLGATIWLFSKFISVELAGVVGSLVAIGVEFIFIRLALHHEKEAAIVTVTEQSTAVDQSVYGIRKAMSPYFFLTGMLVLTRIISPLDHFLTTHLVVDLPSYSFRLPILYSPGFFLLLACLYTIWIFKVPMKIITKSLHSTYKQWIPVTLSTTAFVAMSECMSSAGMISVLAHAAVFSFGSSLIFISPIIAGLGGFLTGSNTGSNAMFIKLQVQAAGQLGISPELLAIAQNTSASHMTMASPSRVLLGLSVCGIPEDESKVLRQIGLIAIGAILLITIVLVILI